MVCWLERFKLWHFQSQVCNIGRQLKHWSFVHFQSWDFIPTDSRGHLVQGWGHQIDFILRFHSLKGSNGFRIYQECVRIAAAVKALEAAPYELIIPSLSLRFRDGAWGRAGVKISSTHRTSLLPPVTDVLCIATHCSAAQCGVSPVSTHNMETQCVAAFGARKSQLTSSAWISDGEG